MDILCLPIAVRQSEIVDQRTINHNPLVLNPPSPPYQGGYRMFGHQGQVKLPCTVFKQGLKCRSDSSFVRNAEPIELLNCGAVGFDWFVGGFKGEGGHGVDFCKIFNSINLHSGFLSAHRTDLADLPVDGHVRWSLPRDCQRHPDQYGYSR